METRLADTAATDSDSYEVTESGALRYRMMAWLPNEVLVPKLASFVVDRDATVLSSSPESVCLRLGHKPRWPWLAPRGDLSLDVTITLRRPRNARRAMTYVVADMRPLARRRLTEAFRLHANEVARALRACLIV